MSYINRTIIVERDSQSLNTQILTMINEFPGIQAAVDEAETAASSASASASEASTAAGEATSAATDAVNAAKFIFADQAALLADNRAFSAGDIILTRAEGFSYEVVSSDPDLTTSGGVLLKVDVSRGRANVLAYGADKSGTLDCTAAFNRAMASGAAIVDVPAGTYRVDGAINLRSGTTIQGQRGASRIKQYGPVLFSQTEPVLRHAKVVGFHLEYLGGAAAAFSCVFKLSDHQYCEFADFYMVEYAGLTIMERHVKLDALTNTTENIYRDWFVNQCIAVDVAIGLEGYYGWMQGEGAVAVLDGNIVWPEQNIGSVIVFKETANRVFIQLAPTTDYTVTYPGGIPRVTTVASLLATERLHLWPASHRIDGNRKPISNNEWRNVRVNYCMARGWTAARWVDAETFNFIRILLAKNQAKAFVTNPGNRCGQGGDFATYRDCVVSYQETADFVTDPSTLTGFDFGPGSLAMTGESIRMDFLWQHGGANRSLIERDRYRVAGQGTVAVPADGTVVTGTDTAFLRDFTMVGAQADRIEINGVFYGIASIDSDTQITLSTPVGAAVSGAAYNRIAISGGTDYDFQFSAVGNGFYVDQTKQQARAVKGSLTQTAGTAVIPNGATNVVVSHGLRRAPQLHEISILSGSGLAGRSLSVSNRSATTFQINASSAVAADANIGWRCNLGPLN